MGSKITRRSADCVNVRNALSNRRQRSYRILFVDSVVIKKKVVNHFWKKSHPYVPCLVDMRKVWVPKEALIPKPFYKRKLFMFFVLLMFSSILFLAYQLYFVNQLQNSTEITERQNRAFEQNKPAAKRLVEVASKRILTKGIRLRDIDNYTKIFTDQKFKCLDGSAEIAWEKLNDDFCDCGDGSDETFTSACPNGKFYCTKQLRHQTGRGVDVWIATSRLNDDVCDCKDCSDEFKWKWGQF